jgi:hypothetical protein
MMVARRLNLSEQMGQPPVAFVEGAAASGHAVEPSGMHDISPVIAVGVFFSTAATDAVYVFFSAAVTARRRVLAASWSSLWYLLSAFVVISYTKNPAYVLVAAAGSWVGAYLSVSYLGRHREPPVRAGR